MTEKALTWEVKKFPLNKLRPYERNPRRISKDAFEKLKASLAEFGYHQRLVCQPDGRIIGGHQRLKALQELGYTDIECLIPSRPLTPEEFRKMVVTDNLPYGEFDFDILGADYSMEEVIEWGMPEKWIAAPVEESTESDGKDKSDDIGDFKFQVVVEAKDESDQAEIIMKLEEMGLTCRPLIL